MVGGGDYTTVVVLNTAVEMPLPSSRYTIGRAQTFPAFLPLVKPSRPCSASVEVHHVSRNLTIWHCFDQSLKADLYSTALRTENGVYLIDPISLSSQAEADLLAAGKVIAVVVTNGNHARDSACFAKRFAVPIYAGIEAGITGVASLASAFLHDEVRVISVDGAGTGEIALYDQRDGGTMIIGDALVNFGSHGFTFLPPKYCSHPKRMRKSLRDLSAHSFDRMCFAHGTPILSHARERLVTLLDAA